MNRPRAACAAALLALALAALPAAGAPSAAASAEWDDAARLGFRRIEGTVRPDLILAQRTIDREWGPSDDSIYVEVEVPGWKSEPLAALLSAGLPGAGQRYVGENSAWLYAAVEAAGWGGWWWYRRDAGRLRDRAEGLAGVPEDPAAGWSFERWSQATEGDAGELIALYRVDREAFYNSIASDPRYAAGWATDEARTEFGALRIRADSRLSRARQISTGIWLNHLVSAVNALRAARFNNMPLSRRVGVRFDGGFRHGGPTFEVAVERRF